MTTRSTPMLQTIGGKSTNAQEVPSKPVTTSDTAAYRFRLLAEGRCEYTKVLDKAETDAVLRYMEQLASDGSSLARAVHHFARKNPELTMIIQSLSNVALAALAEESQRRREVRVKDELPELTEVQQRHFDKAIRFVLTALDAAYVSKKVFFPLFTSEELPELVDASRAKQDIYGSLNKEMIPVLARLNRVVESRGYQMIRWVNPKQDSAVWRFVAEKQTNGA